jgi:menaquinone-dependent protoporphyrinogen oxidase
MMKTAVIYASKHGSTQEVAEAIADLLKDVHQVELFFLKENRKPDISGFDLVVLGSPVYFGRVSWRLRAFCRANKAALLQKQSGLFICGMQSSEAKQEKELRRAYPEALRNKAEIVAFLGGEYLFEEMNTIERIIIENTAKITRSVHRINWSAVESFSRKLMALNG